MPVNVARSGATQRIEATTSPLGLGCSPWSVRGARHLHVLRCHQPSSHRCGAGDTIHCSSMDGTCRSHLAQTHPLGLCTDSPGTHLWWRCAPDGSLAAESQRPGPHRLTLCYFRARGLHRLPLAWSACRTGLAFPHLYYLWRAGSWSVLVNRTTSLVHSGECLDAAA